MEKTFNTLPELFVHAVSDYSLSDALNYPGDQGWRSFSSQDFKRNVRRLALGMHKIGVKSGTTVGILAPSSPEWIIIDLAVLSIGAVSVPLFNKISIESLTHEIADSSMEYLFMGNLEEVPQIGKTGRKLKEIITFGQGLPDDRYRELLEIGRTEEDQHPRLFDDLLARVEPDHLATIIYTSGSTGLPKGVELTHSNIISQVFAAKERFPTPPAVPVVSCLPLAHIFERMVMYWCISCGLRVYFADDPKKLGEYAREVRPAMMTVVPRILEKVFAKIEEGVMAKGGIGGLIARAGLRRAKSAPEGQAGRGLGGFIFDRLLYKKFRAALGGRLRFAISGSAKLAPEICSFFINCGIQIYEGYGLTESSPVIAVNYEGHRKVGSVGPLFPGVQVKISEEGEILAKGPNIMRGYHKLPKATAEVIDAQGWLHTGDLGTFENGYLTITGRKKELFKKSTGEYVPPVPLEQGLVKIPGVEAAIVVADGKPFVTAVLFPDPERIEKLKSEHGFSGSDEAFLDDPKFRQFVFGKIAKMNEHHHHCEHVSDFRFAKTPATIETGELTPTLKIRRHHVEEKFKTLINDMYDHPVVAK